MRLFVSFLFFSLLPLAVEANFAVTETFSSTTQKLSGDLIWNQATGHLHPKMEVRGATAVPDTVVEFGDGRHGHFIESRYGQFGTIDTSGPRKILYLDQTRFDPLQVLSFDIPADWDVIPEGNLPLRIYSLSTVKIFGRLICDGEDGSSPSGAGNLSPGEGGQGRCGGGDGGDGGDPAGNGSVGTSRNSSVTGGGGGVAPAGVSSSGSGGGGGASFSSESATVGRTGSGSGTGGNAGTNFPDDGFITRGGGAGGGGGSGSRGATSASDEAGAGGGGGGGSIEIHAYQDIRVESTGYILARGGDGGSAAQGGPGGAGAGGSIKLWSGGSVHLLNTSISPYPVDAQAGVSGGIPTQGQATNGRTWVGFENALPQGAGLAEPGSFLVDLGDKFFLTIEQTAISKSYDLGTTLSSLSSLVVTPAASADIVIEVAGGNDAEFTEGVVWKPVAQLSDLNSKRYLRFQVKLTNSNSTNPTVVEELKMNYQKGTLNQFEFDGASGCGIVSASQIQRPWGASEKPLPSLIYCLVLLSLLILPLALAVVLAGLFKAQTQGLKLILERIIL